MFLISLLWSQLNLLEILMLNLLGFGEHSGNGVPDIFSIWEEAGLAKPVIEEHFGEDGPNKTVVILPLVAKSAEKKATKKSDGKKATKKRLHQKHNSRWMLSLHLWNLENGIVVAIS